MVMTKNLLFFICPFSCNQEWITNLKILSLYSNVFNGKIAMCIVSGDGLHKYSFVKEKIEGFFPNRNIIWINVDNNPDLGEAKGFVPLIRCVESTDPHEVTFYCHAKGVSPGKTVDELIAVRTWRQLMYTYCLGDSIRINAVLEKWACCGCFKKYGSHHLSTGAPWHYSGTFFWFRNDKIFNCVNWDVAINDRYWVESYLSQFIKAEHAFCLFGNDPWPCNLYKYSSTTWQQFHDIPDTGMPYTPTRATEYLTDGQKIALIKHWNEIKEQDKKTLLLRREGVEFNEFHDWILQY